MLWKLWNVLNSIYSGYILYTTFTHSLRSLRVTICCDANRRNTRTRACVATSSRSYGLHNTHPSTKTNTKAIACLCWPQSPNRHTKTRVPGFIVVMVLWLTWPRHVTANKCPNVMHFSSAFTARPDSSPIPRLVAFILAGASVWRDAQMFIK